MSTTKELLKERFAELSADKEAIRQEVKSMKDEREALIRQMEDLRLKVEELTKKINSVYEERHFLDVNRELMGVAKGLGAVSMTEV